MEALLRYDRWRVVDEWLSHRVDNKQQETIHVKLKPEVHCFPQTFKIVYVKLSVFGIEYLKMSASDQRMEFLSLLRILPKLL